MLFEIISGRPFPRLPIGPNGPLLADGEKVLSLDQCVQRFGRTVQDWRDEWIAVFGRYMSMIAPPADASSDSPSTSPSPALSPAQRVGWDVIRIVRFPHLSDVQWQLFEDECHRRRMHPMDVWVVLQTNDETDLVEPVIVTTIKVFRAKAQASGRRRGESAPEFCGDDGVWQPSPWTKSTPPMAARVYITRTDTDEAFEGLAYWKFCARFTRDAQDRVVLNEYWDKGGPHMLGKCAAAAGYRLAFPELFGDLYTTDEIQVNRSIQRPPAEEAAADEPLRSPTEIASSLAAPAPNPSSAGGIGGEIPDDPRVAMKLIDETTPDLSRLPMELVFSGPCASVQDAKAFIQKCQNRWPRLLHNHPEAFCAAVMDSARRQAAA
jgi:hypothetical protein